MTHDIRNILFAALEEGFICEGSHPVHFQRMSTDDDLLEAVQAALQPFELQLVCADDGLYYFLTSTDDTRAYEQARKYLNKATESLRFTVEFRRLAGKLIGPNQPIKPGDSISHHAAVERIRAQDQLLALVDDCCNKRKFGSKTDLDSKVLSVFEEAKRHQLITKRGDFYIVTAGMLYLQAVIDTIFEESGLVIEESPELAVFQEDLL